MRYEESEVEFEDEVDLLMSSDIVSAQVSTKPISFTKVQSGWFFKEDRQEFPHCCLNTGGQETVRRELVH